jgi:hypothetical protein
VKKLLVLILALGIVPITTGQITLEVREADGETPFDCNDDIMVGSSVAIIVSSDCNDYWSGGLFIEGEDRALGTLAGRGLDPNARNYTDSHYKAAGDFAKVTGWKDSSIWGFDLYTFYPIDGNSENNSTIAGDWFIIDYKADKVGGCNVGFYDYSISWDDPNYFLSFSHSPTRDLNFDEVVNFVDFAIFASQWDATDCNDPNWCDGADLDRDGYVDYNDLTLFVEYWLWPTSPNFPNEPNYPEDPNIIFRIVDANGSSEITIDVNESLTLYVTMETNGVDVFIFDVEIDISDTNLGSIDNTSHPNGTAEILALPRDPFFDYWGPGVSQEEGIELAAASFFDSAISDGHLASFVFTCEGYGDVTLTLINWIETISPVLESIIIHQIDPNSQPMMESGMGGTQEFQQSQSVQVIDVNEQAIIDRLVRWLEEIWAQDETKEIFSEAEWQEFIDSVKNSYQ